VVAGLAGLLRSAAPTAPKATVDAAITGTTDPIAADIGFGRVDAGAAIAAVADTPAPVAPAPASAPVITGTAEVGRTLTTSAGTWTGDPTGYSYAWLRCDAGGQGCAPIPGAASATYAVVSADTGATLRARVTAANAAGAAVAESAATTVVPVPAPARVTTTFTGTLTSRKRTITFTHSVGTGDAVAALAWSRAATMSLTLRAPNGSTLGQVTGSSPLTLTRALSAGTHRWVVSAAAVSKSTPFTLTVAHTAP
jgi:hypothetical protein